MGNDEFELTADEKLSRLLSIICCAKDFENLRVRIVQAELHGEL